MSPLERAAFLLHDVFEMPFDQVADVLRRDSAAVRQLATRARKHIDAGRPRFDATSEDQQRIAAAFLEAAGSGDPAKLAHLLAADVELISDGGGKARAARKVIRGADNVARFGAGVYRKLIDRIEFRSVAVNGEPGCAVLYDGHPLAVLTIETDGRRILGVYTILNPDKLRGLPSSLQATAAS